MTIWDIGKPSVSVEKRRIEGRQKKVRPARPERVKIVLPPAAQSVRNALKRNPMCFPRDWWEPGK